MHNDHSTYVFLRDCNFKIIMIAVAFGCHYTNEYIMNAVTEMMLIQNETHSVTITIPKQLATVHGIT